MVASLSDTEVIWRRASSPPRRMASATSAALPSAYADATLLVAHDNQRAEIETATALNDFRGAVDEHDFLDNFFAFAVKIHLGRFGRRPPATATATGAATAEATARTRGTLSGSRS